MVNRVDEYNGHWISTLLVPKFDFLEPVEEDVHIEDIAHALSMICRFGGHCDRFYSVAEHSTLLVWRLSNVGTVSALTLLAALLHDAEEAYLPDITSPIKHYMPEAHKIYKKLNAAIMHKFGLEKAEWKLIKMYDRKMAIAEAKLLGLWNIEWADVGEPLEIRIAGLPPDAARLKFMHTYRLLIAELRRKSG